VSKPSPKRKPKLIQKFAITIIREVRNRVPKDHLLSLLHPLIKKKRR
jgi:hypothetical protein